MKKNMHRPTRAIIDLKALAYNFNKIKKIVGKKVKVMVTVKADAYGHGIIHISKRLVSLGVDFLGVASIDEAIILREAGIRCPILVLGSILPDQVKSILEYNLRLTICNMEVARALNNIYKKRRKKPLVHLKIDTGMGRQGVLLKDALAFIQSVCSLKSISIEGIFTHFPKADTDKVFTRYQIRLFKGLIKEISRLGIRIPFIHAANSEGVISYKESYFSLVRPGLMVYGIVLGSNKMNLKQVISLKTKIVYLKKVPSGFGVGYGHTFITKRSTMFAILPIGYGDGYPVSLSNKARVFVKKKVAKVIGRVSMDQVAIDVSHIKNIKLGDEVILIGKSQDKEIKVNELSDLSGTIPYEIVCGLGSRVPRVYV